MTQDSETQDFIKKDEKIPSKAPLVLMIIAIICILIPGLGMASLVIFMLIFIPWRDSPIKEEKTIARVCLLLFFVEIVIGGVSFLVLGIPPIIMCCFVLAFGLIVVVIGESICLVSTLFACGTVFYLPCACVLTCICCDGCLVLHALRSFVESLKN